MVSMKTEGDGCVSINSQLKKGLSPFCNFYFHTSHRMCPNSVVRTLRKPAVENKVSQISDFVSFAENFFSQDKNQAMKIVTKVITLNNHNEEFQCGSLLSSSFP